MIFTVEISEQADSDLRASYEYIADTERYIVTVIRVM